MASIPLVSPGAPRSYEARDPRADGQRREIEISRERVVIRRGVGGVPMTIRLPTRDFRGVSLRLSEDGAGYSYELALAHRDADLTVLLARAEDDTDIIAEWRAWARYFGLPTLVERRLGHDEPERPMLGGVLVRQVAPRRRGKWMTARRPRFLARRKLGDPARAVRVEKTREIFPAL